MLKETLEQSLLLLSKSDVVHFDTVCTEINNTRLALLKLEGVNIEELCNQEVMYAAWSKINKETQALRKEHEDLKYKILKLKDQIAEAETKLSSKKTAK